MGGSLSLVLNHWYKCKEKCKDHPDSKTQQRKYILDFKNPHITVIQLRCNTCKKKWMVEKND